MPTANVNGITLDYEERGRPGDPAVLLVMGLGSQRIAWPDELIDGLVRRQLRVVTFDNRDVGKSTIFDSAPASGSTIARALRGERFEPPYTLADMAADAVGLLDHLAIARAHIVGASMGGMIAQHIAVGWPDRVTSLVSVMSTTGSRTVGQATDAATKVLFTPPPSERAAYIEDAVRKRRVLGSRTLFDEDVIRIFAGMAYDRGLHPMGTTRQLLAIYADGDRTSRLASVAAPTLVIHGRHDPLIGVSGGEATAAAIAGARLMVMEEMGHDLPLPLIPELVEEIGDHIRAAETGQEQVA